MEKMLGKIDSAEFGMVKDMGFLMGLILWFSAGGCGVGDCKTYTANISKECKWEHRSRTETFAKIIDDISGILSDAKVNYVSELVGKPVEITIGDDNCLKSFRILTEVL